MSRIPPNRNRYERLPHPAKVVRLGQSAEDDADATALDFYENWNKGWRVQYKNPALASLGIGIEFAPLSVSQRMMGTQSSQSSQSTRSASTQLDRNINDTVIDGDGNAENGDTENNNELTGNISRVTINDIPLPTLLDYVSDYQESDDENTMQYLA
ncbi:uncharacterized protein LOC124459668 [Drosophila willistoni]|uniref:uncharacterized protein LOC124459668 n=1 Tax=Drosophila willistoni TaxID=7260 RepID=UPI00017D6BDB|nr:uncharacterized protein LOC124459668 [Drosophila willistoni]